MRTRYGKANNANQHPSANEKETVAFKSCRAAIPVMSRRLNTAPATEQALRAPASHLHAEHGDWTMHAVPVLVDGVHALAFVGHDGAWSEVLRLGFFEPEPPAGLPESLRTKYFHFPAPGRLSWGHDGQEHEVMLVLHDQPASD